MDQVTAGTLSDLEAFLISISGETAAVKSDALMEAMPTIGNRATSAASMLSASFFEDLLEIQGLPRKSGPIIPDDLGLKPWYAMVGWALADPKKAAGVAVAGSLFMLLAGGLTRMMTQASADTIIGNAANQGGMRVQRVPQAGCCAFCALLASRGAVYRSVESAQFVVGRGAPVGSSPGALGTRPRGSQDLGQQFHDHCRCKVVPLADGNAIELGDSAKDYYDSYYNAAQEVRNGQKLVTKRYKLDDGSLKNKHVWVDGGGKRMTSETTTKMILAKMREDLGVN